MEKTLEGEAAKFVKENQGRIIVGWERLAEEKRRIATEGRISSTFTPLMDNILDFLKASRVVAYESKGSFYLSSMGFNFGPKLSWAKDSFSFKRKEDAVAYAKAFGKHSIPAIDLYEVLGKGDYRILKRAVNKA